MTRIHWKSALLAALLLPAGLFAQTNCDEGAGPLDPALPKEISTHDIIQKFSAREGQFKDAWMSYSFTEDVTVQTVLGDTVDGEFRRVARISFPGGVRKEEVKFSPQNTLVRVSMSKQDFDDIANPRIFFLNPQGLPEYNVLYAGRQKVDELETWVFDVTPRQMQPEKRYFQGRVWIETNDLAVVKSCGKSVPDPKPQINKKKKKRGQPVQEEVSPAFVTYRELIDGQYWFPTYTRSDENLQFNYTESVHIREVIKYQNYRREAPSGAAEKTRP